MTYVQVRKDYEKIKRETNFSLIENSREEVRWNSDLWLVNAGHVTWILTCDLSLMIIWLFQGFGSEAKRPRHPWGFPGDFSNLFF